MNLTYFLRLPRLYKLSRFPKYKRYISEINDEVVDYLSDAKTPIVALYSISDSYYRVII